MKGGDPHGPYWYGYFREGGRVRSVYIGKDLPRGGKRAAREAHAEDVRDEPPEEVPERFAWDGRRMTATTAMRILGVGSSRSDVVGKAYRSLVRRFHPDRARDEAQRRNYTRIMQSVNVAYNTLVD